MAKFVAKMVAKNEKSRHPRRRLSPLESVVGTAGFEPATP
jgi:hypothetical protein